MMLVKDDRSFGDVINDVYNDLVIICLAFNLVIDCCKNDMNSVLVNRSDDKRK